MSEVELVNCKQIAAMLGYKNIASVYQRRRSDRRFPIEHSTLRVKAGSGTVNMHFWNKQQIESYITLCSSKKVEKIAEVKGFDNAAAMQFITGKHQRPTAISTKKTTTVHIIGD